MNFPSNLRFESLSGSTGFYLSCNDDFIIWSYRKFFEITYLNICSRDTPKPGIKYFLTRYKGYKFTICWKYYGFKGLFGEEGVINCSMVELS